MQHARSCWILAAVLLSGCADKGTNTTNPPGPPTVTVSPVTAITSLATGAWAPVSLRNADSVRITFASIDGSDTGSTPWYSSAMRNVPVLGLLPNTQYRLTANAVGGGTEVLGNTMSYTTPGLPVSLTGAALQFTSGHAFSSGLNLVAVRATGGCILLALDPLGQVRWYRVMGPLTCYETKQQSNGHLTVFVGNVVPPGGAYIELTPDGDSVRSVIAQGSPYTDEHELVSTYDESGNLLADYLFGYNLDPTGTLTEHQVVRIAPGGQIDTLVQGWTQWKQSDAIEPGSGNDVDHPNSLGFDLDGGVIVSYRSLSSIVKVDQNNKIQWILGGTKNQFTILNDPLGGFDGQHDVRVLPNGHLLMFDNGWLHQGTGSRAVEYQLDLTNKTATMVWQYVPTPYLFVAYTGSAQRLANGNTLVAFTNQNVLDEVAPDGTLIARAQLVGPGGLFYRVTRIANLYSYRTP